MIHQINSSNSVLLQTTSINCIPPKKQADSSYLIGCVTNAGTPVYIQPPDGVLNRRQSCSARNDVHLELQKQPTNDWVFTMVPESPDVFGNWMSDITARVCDELYNKRS